MAYYSSHLGAKCGLRAASFVVVLYSAAWAYMAWFQWSTKRETFTANRVNPKGLENESCSAYDTNLVPMSVMKYLQETVSSRDARSCEEDSTALIVTCCRVNGNCFGFGDRLRGIGGLVALAKQLSRKICFSKEYFIPDGSRSSCENGRYTSLWGEGMNSFSNGSDSTSISYTNFSLNTGTNLGAFNNEVLSVLRETRYISSNFAPDRFLREYKTFATLLTGRPSLQLGSLSVFLSGVIEPEFQAACRIIGAIAALNSPGIPLVSLHTRVAASVFSGRDGQKFRRTSGADWQFVYLNLAILRQVYA